MPNKNANGDGRWTTTERGSDLGAMSYSYGDDGPDAAISEACLHEVAQAGTDVRTRVGGATIRDGMTYGDYEFYRPSEAMPRKQKEILAACDESYQRIGLLHNIIDLMSDFASQGIEVFHPNKTKQRRYRAWFTKVNGKQVSERFLNLLYRHGNVVVKRAYADLNLGDIDDLERGVAGRIADQPEDIPYERSPKVYKNRIPLQYNFLNPTAVDVVGGDLALFAGKPLYSLRLPEALIKVIKSPKNDDDRRLVATLPDYITRPVRAGKKSIPLDPEKIEVFHYKKDDWMQWAHPMIYSILADLRLYEKNKLADMSALDGAVSHIRLWTLGLPEYKIQPGPAAFAKLREQLAMAAGGGGTLDLMWDASLKLSETSSDIYNFLGMQKYEPVLQAIYAGLGIPQSLTGGKQGGMTGSVVSLKTLIERLQYGRDLLNRFWQKELMLIQEAFGDRNPARVHFDNMSLSDESNEKMLWFHLYDRDIISLDTIRDKFGTIPEVEDARVRSDYKDRDEGRVPDKQGPFVDGQPKFALEKIALQTGVVSPKDVGLDKGADRLLDLEKRKTDLQAKQTNHNIQMQKKQMDVQQQQGQGLHQQQLQHNDEIHKQTLTHKDQAFRVKLAAKPQTKGTPGQGRPKGANDTQKRKKRVDSPRAGTATATHSLLMDLQGWAKSAQRTIADTVTPLYLAERGKKTLRGLTAEEGEALEAIKFGMLCSLTPHQEVAAGLVAERMGNPPAPTTDVSDIFDGWLGRHVGQPTVDEVRDMQATAYAIAHSTKV